MEQLLVLKDLAVIFAVSLLVILAFHRVKLPPLPGFIVAGALLGPNALGLVSDVHRVEGLAEVGVVLLLFTIGIEFSLGRLREMGRQVLVGGGLQVGLTVAAAAAVAAALGHPWRVALFLGCLIALSSTALMLVRIARGMNPGVHIIARTRYVVEIPELPRLGANDVIPEEFETSIEIFARVLAQYRVEPGEVDRLIAQIRSSH